ncbi:MAG: O-antigen ligase family protein [Planctomycetota bacterium]
MERLRRWYRSRTISWPKPDELLLRLGDLGLGVCLLLTPLVLGGRHDTGRFVYALGVVLAGVGVFGARALRGERANVPAWLVGIVSASVALVAVQLIPLPSALRTVGPDTARWLPLWNAETSLGPWRTLTLTPGSTREGLALLVAHVTLLITLLARLRTCEDVQTLLRWIGGAAVGMTLIAFAQYVLPNGKLLWVYDHPHREFGEAVQGTFANKNHFAHFALLGIGPLLAIAMSARQRSTSRRTSSGLLPLKAIATAALAALVVAVFASQSRGAVAALAVASLVSLVIAWRASVMELKQVALLSLVIVGGFVGVSAFGYERISARMGDLAAGSLQQLDASESRRLIWAANVDAFFASPWVGFGAGSHPDVYPLFLGAPTTREFTHAESGYLQIASETGLLGLGLLAAFFITLLVAVTRGAGRATDAEVVWLWLAIIAGLVASAAHSVVDFVWYLPGLLAPTLGLVAAAIRLERLTAPPSQTPAHTPTWGYLPSGTVAAMGCFALITLLGPASGAAGWDRYLRTTVSTRGMVAKLANRGDKPTDPHLEAAILASTDRMVETLAEVVAADPSNARAHLRLARRLVQRDDSKAASGEYAMGVDVIRDAAINGGFANHAAMQRWLDVAFGERAASFRLAYEHAQYAARLGPLQGEAYLVLNALSFLNPHSCGGQELIDQALTVRPHDGDVLYEAGLARWLAGQPDKCLELWRHCVNRPGVHQIKLMSFYGATRPASAMLADLRPDSAATGIALQVYQRQSSPADLLAICEHAATEAQRSTADGTDAPKVVAERWRQVSATLRMIDRAAEAIEPAMQAVELAPQWFPARQELAAVYYALERFDDADPHIRWCLARRPDLRHLKVWLAEGAKRRTAVDRNRRLRLSSASAEKTASTPADAPRRLPPR